MKINFIILLAASIVPLIVGFIWYHPKMFGNTWMRAAGITPENAQGANMAKIFGLTFLLSFFLAFMIQSLVIHQFGTFGLLSQQPDFNTEGSESSTILARIMELYGNSYRTFKHGVFHGVLGGLFIAVPVLGINALFERKGFKYVAVNGGYWMLTMGMMGGIICAFA